MFKKNHNINYIMQMLSSEFNIVMSVLMFHRDMIATGCEDKCVRVFYVAASTDLPLKIFSGKDF